MAVVTKMRGDPGGWVIREFECSFGHKFKDLVKRTDPPPDECPICVGIVAAVGDGRNSPISGEVTQSEAIVAPRIQGPRMSAVKRFERHAFNRVNCDDERILHGDLHDNNREGDVAAVLETERTSETFQMTKEMIEFADEAKKRGPRPDTQGAAQMMPIGGGWQNPGQVNMATLGGPQGAPIPRPAVDIKSSKRL
jgi:hypothetical protein